MGITTGMLIFDDAEELDFVGPWEVFTMVRHILPDDRVITIAPTRPISTWCWCPEALARAARSTTPC